MQFALVHWCYDTLGIQCKTSLIPALAVSPTCCCTRLSVCVWLDVCAASAPCSGEGDIRLVGGSGPHEGRVEVLHNGTWGTVCDDYWDLQGATVVCHQLGYGRAVAAVRNAAYGGGSGLIWYDDVHCNGSEASLTQCTHRGLGVHSCDHNQDAGVICASE